jgi:hypothetical protein
MPRAAITSRISLRTRPSWATTDIGEAITENSA